MSHYSFEGKFPKYESYEVYLKTYPIICNDLSAGNPIYRAFNDSLIDKTIHQYKLNIFLLTVVCIDLQKYF